MPKFIPGLDLLKYLMAIMIVSIHSAAFEGLNLKPWLSVLQSYGVPVFFLLSSLFFMKKVRDKGAQWSLLIHFLKRLGILYGIWFVINLPIYYSQHHNTLELWGFFKGLLFRSTFEGSWFLSALALSVAFVFLLLKCRIPHYLIAPFMIFIYLIQYSGSGILWNSGVEFYETYFGKPITLSFPRGLLWVYIGYLFSNHRLISWLNQVSKTRMKHIAVVFIFAFWVIASVYRPQVAYHVSLILAVITLCAYFYTLQLPESKVWLYLRNCSILYYLLHFMILVYMRNLPILRDFTGLTRFGICLLIATIISVAILYCEKRPWGRLLKYIH